MLKKHKFSNRAYDSFQHRLDCILFAYRNTPSSVTMKTPAELIFKFIPQTRITKLRSNHIMKEKNYQDYQRSRSTVSARHFDVKENVLVKSTRDKEIKWFPGTVIKIISENTYLVNVNGRVRFVHADHLRKCAFHISEVPVHNGVSLDQPSECSVTATDLDSGLKKTVSDCAKDQTVSQTPTRITEAVDKEPILPGTVETPKESPNCHKNSNPQISKTPRPKRLIKPPDRLNYSSFK